LTSTPASGVVRRPRPVQNRLVVTSTAHTVLSLVVILLHCSLHCKC